MDHPKIDRQKIGLLYLSTYAAWAGGLIYVQNIIRALNFLDDDKKPELSIFYGYDSPIDDVISINYPHIVYHKVSTSNKLGKLFYRAKRLLTGKSPFFDLLPEIVYPYNSRIFLGKSRIDWIPDFQERYLPHMFSPAEIAKRRHNQQSISRSGGTVIFSSLNAMEDFVKFYPSHNCKLRLLKFSSILPDFRDIDLDTVLQKYGIGKIYFMSPNQFWKHKNHLIVLQAINALKSKDLDFTVVFTGSPSDPRNNEYFQVVEQYVETNGLQRWVKFLGFIDRAEQLALMSKARAIIQPSLFEGWSTVVEDTKAMGQFILLSDIPLHREQISENCDFFDPHDAGVLAVKMQKHLEKEPEKTPVDYQQHIKAFSETVLTALTT